MARDVVMVNGLPGSGKSSLAPRLARAGATGVVGVWCDVPAEVARVRYVARRRRDVHRDTERLATEWAGWAAEAEPLGLGPVVRVDTTRPVDTAVPGARVKAALWA